MTYRKLSRAITVVALAAAALMAFPAAATAQPGVIHEEGYIVQCSGAGDGYTASVSLYENSQFVDEAQVVIETADGTLIGVTNDGPFLTDGTIDDVVVQVAPEGNPEDPVGSATVSGSYTVSGEPTRIDPEVINEAEFIHIAVGTQTPLTVDLTLEYAGTTIPLECDTAFAFDLMTNQRRIGTPW
jgi:hypothetical protein